MNGRHRFKIAYREETKSRRPRVEAGRKPRPKDIEAAREARERSADFRRGRTAQTDDPYEGDVNYTTTTTTTTTPPSLPSRRWGV